MKKKCLFVFMIGLAVLLSRSPILAQHLQVTMDQLHSLMAPGKKSVLVDVRSLEEYRTGHIPGSLNIPAERIREARGRLPKDKATPLIFYCRGVG